MGAKWMVKGATKQPRNPLGSLGGGRCKMHFLIDSPFGLNSLDLYYFMVSIHSIISCMVFRCSVVAVVGASAQEILSILNRGPENFCTFAQYS